MSLRKKLPQWPAIALCVLWAVLGIGSVVMAQSPTYHRATQTSSSPICPRDSFYDPINGGTCWTCPAGTKRTAYPVTGNQACERVATTEFSGATDRGAPTAPGPLLPKTNCPQGSFLDIGKGRCYGCPGGYSRTAEAVTSGRACSRTVSASFSRAASVGKAGCPSGSFYDPINGGTCWTCPAGTKRTAYPVTGNQACEAPTPPALNISNPARFDNIYQAALTMDFISFLANSGKINGRAMQPGGSYGFSSGDIATNKWYFEHSYADIFGTISIARTASFRGKAYYRWPLAFKSFHSKLLEGLTFAILSDSEKVILTFYGTDVNFAEIRPGNLIYDIANPPVPSPVYDLNTVFPGFAGLAEVIYNEINPLLTREYGIRNKQVIVTGHSLGGAVAGHVAYLLMKNNVLSKTDVNGKIINHRLIMFGTPRFVINPRNLGGLKTSWEKYQGWAVMTSDALEIEEDPTPLIFTSLGLPQLVDSLGQVYRTSKNNLKNPVGADAPLKYHDGRNYIQYAEILRAINR